MAKNYFNRYIWLLDTIQKHRYITLSDLSELWEHSALNGDKHEPLRERTFHNHRAAILDIFGIDIRFNKSRGYYIHNDDLNESDIRNWLLTSLSVNNLINEKTTLRERILLEDIPSGQEFLDTILNAMKESKVLEMTYKKFEDTEPKTYNVSPYCIKLYKQRWYLVAQEFNTDPLHTQAAKYSRNCKSCSKASERQINIYALDRIQKLEPSGMEFKMPSEFNALEYFENWFGIDHEEEYYTPQKIRLKVWNKQRHYFRTLPLHHSQEEVEIHDDWSIFEYFMAPTWDLEHALLQYNDNVEVLEPQCLREQMIEHIRNMTDLYNGRWD